MKHKWCSIVNFIRMEDHRAPWIDHFECVREQMKLIKHYRYPVTWLLQTDAMLSGPYCEFLRREMDANHEAGVWLEITRAHCEAAGVPFHGREGINWDHHSQASLTVGYSQEERLRLTDAAMRIFHDNFGYYPKSVAAWYLDSFTLDYLDRKYHIAATANCRDQWGTDGYSIWGGFWAGGYYPSRRNANLPAFGDDDRINTILFRMLGSCPINQYDAAIGGNGQKVITLEPADCKDPAWISRFYANMFDILCSNYSFVQTGQENSFGWPRMRDGYAVQMRELQKSVREGGIEIARLCDIAEWYKNSYKDTVPVAVVAENDSEGRRSAYWYNTKFYRVSLIRSGNSLAVQDFHTFHADYPESHLAEPCLTHDMVADAPPVVESFLWKQGQEQSFLMEFEVLRNGEWHHFDSDAIKASESSAGMELAVYGADGMMQWRFDEDGFGISYPGRCRFVLPFPETMSVKAAQGRLILRHRDVEYVVGIKGFAKAEHKNNCILLEAEGGLAGFDCGMQQAK